jgi:hypothetical protein
VGIKVSLAVTSFVDDNSEDITKRCVASNLYVALKRRVRDRFGDCRNRWETVTTPDTVKGLVRDHRAVGCHVAVGENNSELKKSAEFARKSLNTKTGDLVAEN